jgi:hypothetical protein
MDQAVSSGHDPDVLTFISGVDSGLPASVGFTSGYDTFACSVTAAYSMALV